MIRTKTKIVWYFIVPMALSGAMLAMYFSGVRLLETIVVAPYFEAVPVNSRREFGLLENLQHLMILAICTIAIRSSLRRKDLIAKAALAFIACGGLVLLLEEIDYGLHLYELFMGTPPEHAAEVRNLHNVGNRTAMLKTVSTTLAVTMFGIAPFALGKTRDPNVRYFLPDPFMLLVLLVALITRNIAHALDDRGMGHGLEGNLSEFRELVMYYLGLVYTVHLARRSPEQVAQESLPPDAE